MHSACSGAAVVRLGWGKSAIARGEAASTSSTRCNDSAGLARSRRGGGLRRDLYAVLLFFSVLATLRQFLTGT